MKEIYNDGFIKSCVVVKLVDKLIDLVAEELLDSDEYYELLDKIKIAIYEENLIYDTLNVMNTDNYINALVKSSLNFEDDRMLDRYYRKLNERFMRLQIPELVVGGFYRDTLVEARVLTEALKIVDKRISEVAATDSLEEEEFYFELCEYSKLARYDNIFTNCYLEMMCLYNGFKIEELKEVYIDDETRYELAYGFRSNAKAMIDLLLENNDYSYDVSLTYAVLFEMSKLEAILDMMDKEEIEKVYNYFVSKKNKAQGVIARDNINKLLVRKK